MLCISGVPMNDCPGGFKVGQISPQCMLFCNKLECFMHVNNTNCSICSLLFTAVRLCVVITRKEHWDF